MLACHIPLTCRASYLAPAIFVHLAVSRESPYANASSAAYWDRITFLFVLAIMTSKGTLKANRTTMIAVNRRGELCRVSQHLRESSYLPSTRNGPSCGIPGILPGIRILAAVVAERFLCYLHLVLPFQQKND